MVIQHNYRNRQEYKTTFILNGAYYVFSVKNFNNNIKNYNLYEMSYIEGFDLDEETDLFIIDKLIN